MLTEGQSINTLISLPPLFILLIICSKEGIRLTADISTISSLREFTEKLKTYEKVESVSIDKIENRPSNALISVTLSIGIKGGAKEK